jgi:hypothetical protein
MKTRLFSLLLLLALLLPIPAQAVEASTLPVYIRWQGVTDVSVTYSVDSRVTNLSVTGPAQSSGVYFDYNYEDGVLKIAAASAKVMDTTQPLATISADLPAGMTMEEAFQMTKLVVNGTRCRTNSQITQATATKDGASVTLSAQVLDDLGGDLICVLAVYDGQGKMIGCTSVPVSQIGSQTITQTFTGCKSAAKGKAFLLDPAGYRPTSSAVEVTIS